MSRDGIANIFGTIAGVPQVLLGITHLSNQDWAEGIAKIAEGVGLFVMAYFIGKPPTPIA